MTQLIVKNTYEANVASIMRELNGRLLERRGNRWVAEFSELKSAMECALRLRQLHGVQAHIEGQDNG